MQALKRSYCQLHDCFLQHASSLSREQQLEPSQKRTKAQTQLDAQTRNRDTTSLKQENSTDVAQPNSSIQPGAQETGSEGSSTKLLTALKQRLDDLPSMARLEQNAASSTSLDQDRMDACAVLTGRKTKYYVHQTTVSVGRSSVQKGQVCLPSSPAYNICAVNQIRQGWSTTDQPCLSVRSKDARW